MGETTRVRWQVECREVNGGESDAGPWYPMRYAVDTEAEARKMMEEYPPNVREDWREEYRLVRETVTTTREVVG